MEVPLTDRNLILKQIRVDDLNDLGQSALAHAFTGFTSEARFGSERVEAYLEEMKSVTGIPDHFFDPKPYRRFAGDALLPRSRYYTIAGDEDGQDDGTLVRELRSYYNPKHAGMIQIFDNTEASDRQILGHLSSSTPNLIVVFLPVRHRPNQFVRSYTDEPKPMLVYLPLQVERRHVKSVVDLRDPTTAAILAQL